jgi:hypothetical protein
MTGWIPRPVGGFIYRPDQRRTIKDRNGNKISIDGHDNQTLIIRTDSDSGAQLLHPHDALRHGGRGEAGAGTPRPHPSRT